MSFLCTKIFKTEVEARLNNFLLAFLPCLHAAAIVRDYSRVIEIFKENSLHIIAIIDNGVYRHNTFEECRNYNFNLHLSISRIYGGTKGVTLDILFSEKFVSTKNLTANAISEIHNNMNLIIPSYRILSETIPGFFLFDEKFGLDEPVARGLALSFISRAESSINEIKASLQKETITSDIFAEVFCGTAKIPDGKTRDSHYDAIFDRIVLDQDMGKPFLGTSIACGIGKLGRLITSGISQNGSYEIVTSGPVNNETVIASLQTNQNETYDINHLLRRHITLSHELAHRFLFHSTSAGCVLKVLTIANKLLVCPFQLTSSSRNWLEKLNQKAILLFKHWYNLHERFALAVLFYELNQIAKAVNTRSAKAINCQCNLVEYEWLLNGLEWPIENSINKILIDIYKAVSDGLYPELFQEIESLLSLTNWQPNDAQEFNLIMFIQILLACLEASSIPLLDSDFLFCDENSFKMWLDSEGQHIEKRWKIFMANVLVDRSPLPAIKFFLIPDGINPNVTPPFDTYKVDFFWSHNVKQSYLKYMLEGLKNCPSPEFSQNFLKDLGNIFCDTRDHVHPIPSPDGQLSFIRDEDAHPFFVSIKEQKKEIKRNQTDRLSKEISNDKSSNYVPQEYNFLDFYVACGVYTNRKDIKRWFHEESWPSIRPIVQQGHNIADILQAILFGQRGG